MSGSPCSRTYTSANRALPVRGSLWRAFWNSSERGIAAADICRDYYPDLSADDVRACVPNAIDLIALEDILTDADTGELSKDVLVEAADELFCVLDAEEGGHAAR